MIEHFFIVDKKGFALAARSFLTEPNHQIITDFHERVSSNPPPDPVFQVDGMNYASYLNGNLYFVLATHDASASGSTLLNLLERLVQVITDYAGTCTELVLQRNLALVFEIVEEVICFGFPQATDSTNLLHLVHNTVKYDRSLLEKIDVLNVFPEHDFDRPIAILQRKKDKLRNEMFVVLTEKLNVVLDCDNHILRCETVGSCLVKSFLQGQPVVYIQLDPHMTVETRKMPQNFGLDYDDIVFAPFVYPDTFDVDRSFRVAPPEGQNVLFTYRTGRPIILPYTISVVFENRQPKAAVVRVSLQSNYPAEVTAEDVAVIFQCPVETSNAACELPPTVQEFQSQEYDEKERQVTWRIKKFKGLCEYSARFRFIFDNGIPVAAEKILGPISLKFNIVDYVASGLSIHKIDVSTSGSEKPPKKWMRQTTIAGDYTYELM